MDRRKMRVLLAALVFLLVGGVFVFGAPRAFAVDFSLTSISTAASQAFISQLINGINKLLSGILYMIVALFSMATAGLKTLILESTKLFELPEITTGWRIVRDTMNSFFIVVLIAIAISTIIRFQQFNFRSTLPRLIIAAFLVNFSRTICLLAINASNSLMATFGTAVADALPIFAIGLRLPAVSAVQPASLSNLYGIIPPNISDSGWEVGTAFGALIASLFGIFMALVALGAIVFFLILLAFRVIVLWFLMILSPLAFFLWGTPGRANSYWGQWLNEFVQHLLVGPVATFFLYIILMMMIANIQHNYVGDVFDPNLPSATGTLISSPRLMFGYLIGLGMMFVALEIIQQMGVRGGDFAQRVGVDGIIKGGVRGARALAGYTNDLLYSRGLSVRPSQAWQGITTGISQRRQHWIEEGNRVMAKRVATAEESGSASALLWATASGNEEFWEKNGIPELVQRGVRGAKRVVGADTYREGMGTLQTRLEHMYDRQKASIVSGLWTDEERRYVEGKTGYELGILEKQAKEYRTHQSDMARRTALESKSSRMSVAERTAWNATDEGAEYTRLVSETDKYRADNAGIETQIEEAVKNQDVISDALKNYYDPENKAVNPNAGERLGDAMTRVAAQVGVDDRERTALAREVNVRMANAESALSVARASFGDRIGAMRSKKYPHMEDHDPIELANTALAHMDPKDKAEFAAPLVQAAEEGKIEEVLQVLDPNIEMTEKGMESFTKLLKERVGYSDDEVNDLKAKIQAFAKKSGLDSYSVLVKRSSAGRIVPASSSDINGAISKGVSKKGFGAKLQTNPGAFMEKKGGKPKLRSGFWVAVEQTGRDLDNRLRNLDRAPIAPEFLKLLYKDLQRSPSLRRHVSEPALSKLKSVLGER